MFYCCNLIYAWSIPLREISPTLQPPPKTLHIFMLPIFQNPFWWPTFLWKSGGEECPLWWPCIYSMHVTNELMHLSNREGLYWLRYSCLISCFYFYFSGQCEPLRPLYEIWRTKCHILWWSCIQWLNGMLISLLLSLTCSLLETRILCGGKKCFCRLSLCYMRDWLVKCNSLYVLTRCCGWWYFSRSNTRNNKLGINPYVPSAPFLYPLQI